MNENKKLIPNALERRRVILASLILVLAVTLIVVATLLNKFNVFAINFRTLRGFRGVTGQLAEIGFIFSISMFFIRRIIKRIKTKNIRTVLVKIAKFVREWHVPISILAFAIIIIHAYIMVFRGFIFNVNYITGAIAFIILSIQMLSGVFRYKRVGVKFHMILGVSFIAVMLIHVLL